jgi:DNA-binding NarL/FixJ family response regulator
VSVRIVIADDHEVIRQGVRRIVEARPGWEVCGEAENGREAVSLAQDLNPDVIVMDISMPVMGGLEATREILTLNANIRVLIFTMHKPAYVSELAKKVGARGLVTKSEATRDLVCALDCVLSGGTFFPPSEDGSASAELA